MPRKNTLKEWKDDPRYRLLQAEVDALSDRLGKENELGKVIRALWGEHRKSEAPNAEAEEEHLAFYRQVLAQMMLGKFERIVPPDPITDTDNLGNNLAQMNVFLDQKFAEVRAFAEVSQDINSGRFVRDVMNHIFKTFQTIIPFDQLSLAFVEHDDEGAAWVRSNWSQTTEVGSANAGSERFSRAYAEPLESSGLRTVAETKKPRIINDMASCRREHPQSLSIRMSIKDGIFSDLTCPLFGKDGLLGFLFFSSHQRNVYTENHAAIFQTMAKSLAHTLEKCRLYEELTLRNQFIRNVFGRYISDEIADELLKNTKALKMGGHSCKVTILMSDIRGFTKMSEHMRPEDVVTVLNIYFNEMVNVIHRHNGTIDNIIGDAIMVLFGAPIARHDDVHRAIACAQDMQAAMARVNRSIASMSLPELSMGIGINTGNVVAGNIGSEAHTKYSVIGAPVNLAARLESKAQPGEILLSPSTYDEVGNTIQIAEERDIVAKGFSDPVRSYVLRPSVK